MTPADLVCGEELEALLSSQAATAAHPASGQ
jgi:hypothetical protein